MTDIKGARQRLAEWDALTEEATPGPWEADGEVVASTYLDGAGFGPTVAYIEDDDCDPAVVIADAAFIAATRTAMPALVAFARDVLGVADLWRREPGFESEGEAVTLHRLVDEHFGQFKEVS